MWRGNVVYRDERVVRFDPESGEYYSIILEIYENGEITFSGHHGLIIPEKDLEEAVKDYWDNIDLEDEFGYLADERGIYDPEERKEFLESLAEELKEDFYPYEVIGWLKECAITLDGAGQLDDYIASSEILVAGNKEDLMKLLQLWSDFHMKKVPKDIQELAKELLSKFPTFEEVEKELLKRKKREIIV